jgi:hypothetical protein
MKEEYNLIKQSKLRRKLLEDSFYKPSRGDIVFTETSVGIILNQKEGIEQDKKKKVKKLSKIKDQIYAIWHKKNITPFEQTKIVYEAKKLIKIKDIHLLICYKYAIGETFNINNSESLETSSIEDYLLDNQKEWKFFQSSY